MPLFRARGFGLDWQADTPLDQFDLVADTDGAPDIVISEVDHLEERTGGRRINRGSVYVDGFRFSWPCEAIFDVHNGNRIAYCKGPEWRGTLPASFYSTVVALTLAWRGKMPFHATAIEIGGKAILLAGKPGAGKSTLAAELLEDGGKLISDDLTILRQEKKGSTVTAFRGRRAIRLHPATAEHVDMLKSEDVPEDPRGKILVWPKARTTEDALPVAGLIVLGKTRQSISALELAPILPKLLFRPNWMATMPGQAENRLALLALTGKIPAISIPRISGFTADERRQRHAMLHEALAQMAAR